MTDFKTSGYFHWTVTLVGFILVPIGLAVFVKSAFAGMVVLLVSLIILTTHYRLKVDLGKRTFHDYLWLLGMKFGEKGTFENIECLLIRKTKVNQTMNHMAGSATLRKEVYSGYLKFSDRDGIHLTTLDSKERLIRRLGEISKKLNTEIVDNSVGIEERKN